VAVKLRVPADHSSRP